MRKAVVFEVNRKHYAETRNTACRSPFHKDETVFERLENALVHVLLHSAVYLVDTLLLVRVFEVYFGEHEFERTRSVTDVVFKIFPILTFGSELIASHHRPFGKIAIYGH